MLADVLRMALHLDYDALIDKQYWTALQESKETRAAAEKLLDRYPDCYDANLAIGVENYLLSQKPAPVRIFLRMTGSQTDEEAGIARLRIVAEKGHYLKPYAKILLVIAALRRNNRPEAKQWLMDLAAQFPENNLFREELKKLS